MITDGVIVVTYAYTACGRGADLFQAEVFVNHVRKAIRRANVRALQNGSRDAEVVEWYYQYQADLAKEAAFMSNKHIVHMCHTLPGQAEIRRSYFHVSVSSDSFLQYLFSNDRKHCFSPFPI